ncbi:MAG: hypothetical protein JKY17_06625 [Magnetovibrio sp.]|nr:hypothetical protein [Magnetovibrio sp.]
MSDYSKLVEDWKAAQKAVRRARGGTSGSVNIKRKKRTEALNAMLRAEAEYQSFSFCRAEIMDDNLDMGKTTKYTDPDTVVATRSASGAPLLTMHHQLALEQRSPVR